MCVPRAWGDHNTVGDQVSENRERRKWLHWERPTCHTSQGKGEEFFLWAKRGPPVIEGNESLLKILGLER